MPNISGYTPPPPSQFPTQKVTGKPNAAISASNTSTIDSPGPSKDQADKLNTVSKIKVGRDGFLAFFGGQISKLCNWTHTQVAAPLFRAVYGLFVRSPSNQPSTSSTTVSARDKAEQIAKSIGSGSKATSTARRQKEPFATVYQKLNDHFKSVPLRGLKVLYDDLYTHGVINEETLIRLANAAPERFENLNILLDDPKMGPLINRNSKLFLMDCEDDVLERLVDNEAVPKPEFHYGPLTLGDIVRASNLPIY